MFNDTIIILDINECEKESHNCHSNAKCINTNGSFTCQCKGGYEGDGLITCQCKLHALLNSNQRCTDLL